MLEFAQAIQPFIQSTESVITRYLSVLVLDVQLIGEQTINWFPFQVLIFSRNWWKFSTWNCARIEKISFKMGHHYRLACWSYVALVKLSFQKKTDRVYSANAMASIVEMGVCNVSGIQDFWRTIFSIHSCGFFKYLIWFYLRHWICCILTFYLSICWHTSQNAFARAHLNEAHQNQICPDMRVKRQQNEAHLHTIQSTRIAFDFKSVMRVLFMMPGLLFQI